VEGVGRGGAKKFRWTWSAEARKEPFLANVYFIVKEETA
jgi:hypothetical protein